MGGPIFLLPSLCIMTFNNFYLHWHVNNYTIKECRIWASENSNNPAASDYDNLPLGMLSISQPSTIDISKRQCELSSILRTL